MGRTALRTVQILEIISANDQMTLSQIVSATGMPKTSAYDILKTLESCQAIYRREGSDPSYSIGFRTYIIGNSYKKTSHLLTNAKAHTQQLVDALQKTVLLGKFYENSLLVIDKIEPQTPVVVTPAIGDTMSVHASAMGILLQIYCNNQNTNDSEKDAAMVFLNQNGYYVKGIAEGEPVYSIAAPIFNFEQKMASVVGVMAFNSGKVDVEYEGEQVRQCAKIISKNMGMREA